VAHQPLQLAPVTLTTHKTPLDEPGAFSLENQPPPKSDLT
jgi:hypothetical protein